VEEEREGEELVLGQRQRGRRRESVGGAGGSEDGERGQSFCRLWGQAGLEGKL
jgi:hypothetical protein